MVTERRSRYSLRKLSVGVASVLLGTTVYGYNVAHADENVAVDNSSNNAQAGSVNQPYADHVTCSKQADVNMEGNQPAENSSENSNVNQQVMVVNNNIQTATFNLNNAQPVVGLTTSLMVNDPNRVAPAGQSKAQWDSFDWLTQTDTGKPPVSAQITNYMFRWGFNGTLRLSADQLSRAQTIDLFEITQRSNNSGRTTQSFENNGTPFTLNGQQVGYFHLSADLIPSGYNTVWQPWTRMRMQLVIDHPLTDISGVQRVKVDVPWAGTIGFQSPYSFRGVQSSDITYIITGLGIPSRLYKAHYYWPDGIRNIIDLGNNWYSKRQQSVSSTLTQFDGGHLTTTYIYPSFNSQEDEGKFAQSHGTLNNQNHDGNLEAAVRIRADDNALLLKDTMAKTTKEFIEIPAYRSDGQMYASSQALAGAYGKDINVIKCEPNLTLSQLKAKFGTGFFISQQSDGSLLVYERINKQDLKLQPDQIEAAVNSLVITSPNLNSDLSIHTDAQAKTVARQWINKFLNGPFKGIPINVGITGVSYLLTNPVKKTIVHVDNLDVNTGKTLETVDAHNSFNSAILEGQSQIAVHYVDANSHVEVQQADIHTDWANNSLTIQPNLKVKGYHLTGRMLDKAFNVVNYNLDQRYPVKGIKDIYLEVAPDEQDVSDTDPYATATRKRFIVAVNMQTKEAKLLATQTVTLHAKAIKTADGKVHYSDWTTGKYPEYQLPDEMWGINDYTHKYVYENSNVKVTDADTVSIVSYNYLSGLLFKDVDTNEKVSTRNNVEGLKLSYDLSTGVPMIKTWNSGNGSWQASELTGFPFKLDYDSMLKDYGIGDKLDHITTVVNPLNYYDVLVHAGSSASMSLPKGYHLVANQPQTGTVAFGQTGYILIEKDTSPANFIFHDLEDNQQVGSTITVNAKYGEDTPVSLTVPDGYVLSPDQTLPTSVRYEGQPIAPRVINLYKASVPTYYDFLDRDTNKRVDLETVNAAFGKSTVLHLTVPEGYILAPGSTLPTSVDYEGKPLPPHIIYVLKASSSVIYQFIDVENNNQVVGQHSVQTTYGKTTPVSLTVPKYYELVNSEKLPTGASYSRDPQTVQIKVRRSNAKISYQFVDQDTGQDVGNLITVNGKYGLAKSVNLTIPSDYQLASGQSLPMSVTFSAVNMPEVKIMVVRKPSVAQYQFVDDMQGGQNVGNVIQIKGKTGLTGSVSLTVPKNYQLAAGQTLPTSVVFTAGTMPVQRIHLVHVIVSHTEKVTSRLRFIENLPDHNGGINPKTLADINIKADREHAVDQVTGHDEISDWTLRMPVYEDTKDPIDHGDQIVFSKEISDHFLLNHEDDNANFKLAQSNWLDYVSGYSFDIHGDAQHRLSNGFSGNFFGQSIFLRNSKSVFGWLWIPNNYTGRYYEEVSADVKAMSMFLDQISQVGHPLDDTVYLDYTPLDQSGKIIYQTPDGRQQISSAGFSGKTDQTVNLSYQLPEGYHLYGNQSLVSTYKMTPEDNTKVVLVTPNETTYQEHKTVTRRIHLRNQVVTQSVNFIRDVKLVGNDRSYGDWSAPGYWLAYRVPVIDGFVVNQSMINAELVSADSADQDVYVDYQPVAKPRMISFVLANGQVIKQQQVEGNVDVASLIPEGYQLLSTGTSGSRYLVTAKSRTYLAHDTDIPADIEPLAHVVTRTIIVPLANGRSRKIIQRVKFERTATVNQATGEVTYSDWQAIGSGKFNRINVPRRLGKRAKLFGGSVSAQVVKPTDHNTVVRVRYL